MTDKPNILGQYIQHYYYSLHQFSLIELKSIYYKLYYMKILIKNNLAYKINHYDNPQSVLSLNIICFWGFTRVEQCRAQR